MAKAWGIEHRGRESEIVNGEWEMAWSMKAGIGHRDRKWHSAWSKNRESEVAWSLELLRKM
jgi:hypothetical protein